METNLCSRFILSSSDVTEELKIKSKEDKGKETVEKNSPSATPLFYLKFLPFTLGHFTRILILKTEETLQINDPMFLIKEPY